MRRRKKKKKKNRELDSCGDTKALLDHNKMECFHGVLCGVRKSRRTETAGLWGASLILRVLNVVAAPPTRTAKGGEGDRSKSPAPVSQWSWTCLKYKGCRFRLSVHFSHSVVSNSLQPHGTPGLPVHYQLLEFTPTHVHWVGDAIQPSHPLSFLSPPTFNLSQHQGLFKWIILHIRGP